MIPVLTYYGYVLVDNGTDIYSYSVRALNYGSTIGTETYYLLF